MHPEDEWNLIRKDRAWRPAGAGMGLVRIALLFAFAMILVPIVDDRPRDRLAAGGYAAGVDYFETGTVKRQETYTIRRSVLQPSPHSVCAIHADGRREGDC
jgi:hypothetical protein